MLWKKESIFFVQCKKNLIWMILHALSPACSDQQIVTHISNKPWRYCHVNAAGCYSSVSLREIQVERVACPVSPVLHRFGHWCNSSSISIRVASTSTSGYVIMLILTLAGELSFLPAVQSFLTAFQHICVTLLIIQMWIMIRAICLFLGVLRVHMGLTSIT